MGYLAFILLLKRLISVEELSNLIVVFSLSIFCAYVLVCGLDSRLLYGSGNGLDAEADYSRKPRRAAHCCIYGRCLIFCTLQRL